MNILLGKSNTLDMALTGKTLNAKKAKKVESWIQLLIL